jgi:scyllo-inositol 2-dehydrogenase (NADP+)
MAVKWGFIGSGGIIPRFMRGLLQVKDAVPEAIYARNKEKAVELSKEYGIKKVYDDFGEFVNKSGIDIAYVATPHSHHIEFTLGCLEAKIPVLCEKAMGPNREHVQKMIECAKKNDTFLAEAFWTACFPLRGRPWSG